jgi:hypothetical protein
VAKKVVRVESTPQSRAKEPTWKPTPEAKAKATRLRIFAVVLWLLAIAGEVFAVYWVLKRNWKGDENTLNMAVLIGAIVVIALLAIAGSWLWKRANKADPASRAEPIRFFIQNQLGVIISILAFLPLIILIFTNKNMGGQQKAIAGGIGIVALLIAGLASAEFTPSSIEQYQTETQRVVELTGQDQVFWTKEGKVYHLCEAASAVNLTSKDNTIYSGTVGDAHAAGKERLTLQVEQEMKQCGYTMPSPTESSQAVAPGWLIALPVSLAA